jgi:hypothetical protein
VPSGETGLGQSSLTGLGSELAQKRLKTHPIDWAQIDRFLAGADKKLASARKILAFDEEACLQRAYEEMLKASLGFMFSHGFRARSQPGHHIAIIEFVRQRIDRKHAGLLTVLNGLRRKRNQALYDDTDLFLTTTLNEPSKQPATTWKSFERTSPRENHGRYLSRAANLSRLLPGELILMRFVGNRPFCQREPLS